MLAVLLLAGSPVAAATMIAGGAKVDETPEYPVWLWVVGGRTTPTSNILQRIHAKTIAIGGDEENPAILITLDALGASPRIRNELVRRLEARTKVREAGVAICTSHPHAAPLLSGDDPSQREGVERYTRDLIDKRESVSLAALADRRPSKLSWGAGQVSWGRNRRPAWAFQPVDHSLPVLRVDDAEGRMRAVLASYACHATSFGGNNQLHGDGVGCAQAYMEKEMPGVIGMVAIGCGGDTNPLPRGTWDHALQYGHALGAEAKRVAAGPLKPISARLECRTRTIAIPLDKIPSRAEFEARTLGKTAKEKSWPITPGCSWRNSLAGKSS